MTVTVVVLRSPYDTPCPMDQHYRLCLPGDAAERTAGSGRGSGERRRRCRADVVQRDARQRSRNVPRRSVARPSWQRDDLDWPVARRDGCLQAGWSWIRSNGWRAWHEMGMVPRRSRTASHRGPPPGRTGVASSSGDPGGLWGLRLSVVSADLPDARLLGGHRPRRHGKPDICDARPPDRRRAFNSSRCHSLTQRCDVSRAQS
jgi:hypothetical protein